MPQAIPHCQDTGHHKELEDYWIKELKLNESEVRQTRFDFENSDQFYTLKTDILRNNIYGVDLDPKAVEIAQLNLLLQVSERKHRLPLLQNNIRVGNSLIDDPTVSDRAFKWEEGFQDIMVNGGFDIVIGNPPYVRHEELKDLKPYLESNYKSFNGKGDLLTYFFEKGISLLRENGHFGFISSNKFMRSDYGKNLREYLLSNCRIEQIIDFGELPVFNDASTFPCIFVLNKKEPRESNSFTFCGIQTLNFGTLSEYVRKNGYPVKQLPLDNTTWSIGQSKRTSVIRKMERQSVSLKEYIEHPLRGILTGFNEAFIIDEKTKENLIKTDPKNDEILFPVLRGKDIKDYGINDPKLWLILSRDGMDIPNEYPEVYRHLLQYRGELEKRTDQGQYWYNLRPCSYYDKFEAPKIIYGDISLRNRFTIDTKGYYPLKTCFIIPKADKYLLALLNSKLFEFYMRQNFPILGDPVKGGRILHGATYMNKLPIKIVDTEKQIPMIKLVDKMLTLNYNLAKRDGKLTDERTRLEEETEKIRAEIDSMVYDLYGLNEKERKIVEET